MDKLNGKKYQVYNILCDKIMNLNKLEKSKKIV